MNKLLMKIFKKVNISIILIQVCTAQALPQNENISEKEKLDIINTTLSLLKENYIDSIKANIVASSINSKFSNGDYALYRKQIPFLEQFERDIQHFTGDSHIGLGIGKDRVKQIIIENTVATDNETQEFDSEFVQNIQFENFRLRKLEYLEGNIGYFSFLSFTPIELSKESIVGAMNFLRYSSAIIIDLRNNGGGYSETMDFLLSYFLPDSTQIGELKFRQNNKVVKTYTVQDKLINKIPSTTLVYILVSNKTSSAAEGFTYTLQQYKRATVVGAQTKGEGNPGELFVINDVLYIMIPTIESVNPISKKSIDGVGVTPDIQISTDKSLNKAKIEIYSNLADITENEKHRLIYQWQIPYLQNELSPEPLTKEIINSVVGIYEEGRQLIYDNSDLIYVNTLGERQVLQYIGNGVFQNTEKSWLRLVMPFTDKPIPYFEWVWDDGTDPQHVKRE